MWAQLLSLWDLLTTPLVQWCKIQVLHCVFPLSSLFLSAEPSASSVTEVDKKFMTLLAACVDYFCFHCYHYSGSSVACFSFRVSSFKAITKCIRHYSTVNSNDNVSDGSTGNSVSLPEITVVNLGIYSEIKDVSKRGDTNVIIGTCTMCQLQPWVHIVMGHLARPVSRQELNWFIIYQ